MRTAAPIPVRFAFALALLAAGGPAPAQKPKVTIEAARVGLPPGSRNADRNVAGQAQHQSKIAAWAPLYLDIKVEDEIKGPAEVVVETQDPDAIATTLALPLNALTGATPGVILTARDFDRIPYVRPVRTPDGQVADITVRVRAVNGRDLGDPHRVQFFSPRDPLTYLVVSLGSKLPGFDLPKPPAASEQNAESSGQLRNGRVQTAAITTVDEMPDRWFGYDAADLVVLTTGDGAVPKDFLPRLFGDQATPLDRVKRAALLEWVRRGGRMVVSVGSNAGLLAQMPAFQELVPLAVRRDPPSRAVPSLELSWRTASVFKEYLRPRVGTVPVANLDPKPGRPARVLIRGNEESGGQPLVAQAPLGLGRVTLVGFDLDRSPFTEIPQKPQFWDWVLREGGAARAAAGGDAAKSSAPTFGSQPEAEDELAVALRTHADTFDGVPVISFGWVAVFIVLYILLIGPVEYFVLKKVFGRLELTWVTFPVIVLTVSAVAYFTAYAVKGRDLKLNKIDVVDVDAAGGRVYGQTWFTVFSPRIDTYTNTVVPADGWTPDPPEATAADTLAGWVGAPKGSRGSIISRRYRYHVGPGGEPVANALDGVPVQVWSTKSFTAQWAARLDPDPGKAAVESKLYHPPGDPTQVIGSFVNRMPFDELRGARVYYAGKSYPVGRDGLILRGDDVPVVLDKGEPAEKTVKAEANLDRVLVSEGPQTYGRGGLQPGKQTVNTPGGEGGGLLPGILFHDLALQAGGGPPKNSSLRRLDQSWRLDEKNTDEVVLVARAPGGSGPADDTLNGSNSPSRLWLKAIPAAGGGRPPVPGTGRQETMVRVYLPVKAAGR